MGKRIIIKGADFSENALSKGILAIDSNDDIAIATRIGTTDMCPYADVRYANLYGKTVVGIEFKPAKAGNLTIVSLYNRTLDNKASVTITDDMIGVKTYFPLEGIQVRNEEILGVVTTSDTGMLYVTGDDGTAGLIRHLGSSSQATSSRGLSINWYVLD